MSQKRTHADILADWNKPGLEGFLSWLADVQPRILNAKNRFIPFELQPWQRDILAGELAVNEEGNFQHSITLTVTPRRHSKTTLHALVVLWLWSSRENWTFQLLGNSEDHTRRVPYRMLLRIIENTPALSKMINQKKDVDAFNIKNPTLGNVIQLIKGTAQQVFGDKVNLLWVSDFHACPDLAPFEALQASMLDSEGTLLLIDSNAGGEGDHVHRLEQEAEKDSAIFAHRVEYASFEEYLEAAPPWIDRDKAKRLQRTTLPQTFDRDILGKRTSGVSNLFSYSAIQACMDSYLMPVAIKDLPSIFGGRKFVCGGGLDRAYGFSLHGDGTIWTTVAKVANDDGEAEYYLLNQKSIAFSQGKAIKKAISRDNAEYELSNVGIESYNAQDIAAWLNDSKIPNETIFASNTAQVPAFTELHRIVAEGRLHFPAQLKELAQEMSTFTYDASKKTLRFEAAPKFHDDRVYSLAWAIYALRETELATYELPSIVCASPSRHAEQCYLRRGNLILPCGEYCEAHKRVETMHLQFSRRKVDAELSLPEFFHDKVKLSGGKIYQGL